MYSVSIDILVLTKIYNNNNKKKKKVFWKISVQNFFPSYSWIDINTLETICLNLQNYQVITVLAFFKTTKYGMGGVIAIM